MKINFLTQPHIEPRPETNEVELTADFDFLIDEKVYSIPLHYRYDGASIPRPFWSIIGSPFEPDFSAASCVHDILYLSHKKPRSQADEIFFQLLRLCGVGLWRARIMWAAVRTGAAFAWKNSASDEIAMKNLIGSIRTRGDAQKFTWLLV